VRLKLYFGIFCGCLVWWPASLLVHSSPHRSAVKTSGALVARPKFSIPLAFEPNLGQADPRAEFAGRVGGFNILLTRAGIELTAAGGGERLHGPRNVSLNFFSARNGTSAKHSKLAWLGQERAAGQTNYFLGNDPARWRTHVPQFGKAVARGVVPGVDLVAYGNDERLEYDLRIAPGARSADLRLAISGVKNLRVDAEGDLVMAFGPRELRMKKPVMYQETAAAATAGNPTGAKTLVNGSYVLEADGSVGFSVGAFDPSATLVIDPSFAVASLSVGYTTFLGGAGDDRATSVALDTMGKVYIGGTTTSVGTFIETSGTDLGSEGGSPIYFIAKIDPTKSGPSSLVYLTFIGGSGSQTGGEIAVDANGNVALAGVTTSADYPVTDASTLTAGAGGIAVNDASITEIGPTGATLVYSTLFGGNGNEATVAAGGIAFDSLGNIFVGMDTKSTNLTVAPAAAPGPFQSVYGGGFSDGFLAVFQPVVSASAAHLKYCTYLGINAQATVTGVSVDSVGNAYLAGYTSDPLGTLATTNGFQTVYGGGTYNGFVMKILPSGAGPQDLSYGTLLGGSGSDQALAIAVGEELPGTVYVTGTTQSANFPVNGTIGPLQSALDGDANGTANAFVSVIAQLPSGATKLAYSSYLGGSQSDAGLGIFFAATNQIYVTGRAKSWDFPWQYNFQPFSGDEDAFVAEIDATSAGPASLLYATPLGGSAAAGMTATAQGNGIAADAAGNFYVAGATNAGNFPATSNPNNGMQLTCASCQQNPPLNDAFLLQGVPSSATAPSVSFNVAKVNFGFQPVGGATVPQGVAVMNTGDAPLAISNVNITGPNAADFSLMGASGCIANAIPAGQKCSFEVGFMGSVVGPEEAFITLTDNGPAGSQTLPVVGMGGGPFAMVSPGAINFGNQPINSRSNTFLEVTLTNTGSQALSYTQAISGPDASQFQPGITAEACLSAGTAVLAAGQSCVVPFYFAPTTTGTLTAEVVFIDNSGGLTGAEQVVPITGVGTGVAPILAMAPASLNFGSQPVGITSAAQNVMFTNNGSGALNISSFVITGANSTSFGYVARGPSACTLPTTQLSPGASCTLSVDFIPIAAGAVSAALTVTDNAQGSPQAVALSGNGGTSGISIAPSSVSFASATVGSPSAAVPVTVTNTGTSPLALTVTLAGGNPADFTEADTCSQSPLGAGKTCLINVAFDPTHSGNRSAVVAIADDVPGSPQTVPLSGSAVQATATVSPIGPLTFGSQLVGTASATQTVTITNSGSGAAVLSVNSASATPFADFTLVNNCKSGVAAGGSCTIGVTFTPPPDGANTLCGSTAGPQNSVLKIFDNDPASPQMVTLSGVAQDYCLASSGAMNATVTAGGSAEFPMDAQAQGFGGTVALTCAATIPQGGCSVTPASVMITGGAPVPFQVSVTTTAATTSAAIGSGPGASALLRLVSCAFAGLLLLLLTQAAPTQRYLAGQVHSHAFRMVQAGTILVLLSLGLAACFGGQGAAVQPVTGTPAGTYPVTVTGTTTSGATRTIGLSLTVQ
jgi:hypothetical protein